MQLLLLSGSISFRIKRQASQNFAVKGQALVEFALLAPLVVLIIVGVFDLGRAFLITLTLQNAAREGARYATRHMVASVEQAELLAERVQDELVAGRVIPDDLPACSHGNGRPFVCQIESQNTVIMYQCNGYRYGDSLECASNGQATVQVTYEYQSIFSIVLPAAFDLHGEASFMTP